MKVFSVSANTRLTGIASLLVDVSSEMIFPLLPFFLTNILLAPVFVIGLLESLGEVTLALVSFLSGIYSDRIGKRKGIIVGGYAASAVFKAFLPFVTSWPQVAVIRMLDRAGKGARVVPRDALIGMSEPKENLGHAFGFRKMMDNIGAILGPLIATFFIIFFFNNSNSEESYRALFAIAIVPAVLAMLFLAFIKDPKSNGNHQTKRILLDVFKIPNFKQFMLSGAVFSLGQFSIMFFLLRANEFMPLYLIPLGYLSFNIFYTIFSYPAGILSDKFGARKALIFAMLCFIASIMCIGFFPSMVVIFISFALLGLFMAIADTAPQVFLTSSLPQDHYASAIGSYKGITGLTSVPANLLAGLLWTIPIFSVPATFIFSIITSVLGILCLVLLVKEGRGTVR